MKIAIVGAGFTGLAAAYKLSVKHDVTVFEKDDKVGGLAVGFKMPGWEWSLEKHYHHWFTNDYYILNIARELGLEKELLFPPSLTSIYYGHEIYPFNSPSQILNFSPLPLPDRVRLGIVSAFLKGLFKTWALNLERTTADAWLQKYYGKKTYEVVWKPLLYGKFGPFAKQVNMAWFWARIKKRTLKLGYIKGGYQFLAEKIAENIRKKGGKILLNTSFNPKESSGFDKVIMTAPSSIFTKIYPALPQGYKNKLNNIPHLHALNLLLITKERFLDKTYWLNINEEKFPFISVVEHTNFIDPKYYGGNHLIYVGNYLPDNHPYLKMTKEQLFQTYLPYLKKINPSFNFQFSIFNFQMFSAPNAQPVFGINYSKDKPSFQTPVPNVYLANLDMVYPWDRGTNYAIEMGYKVAEFI